MTVRLRPWAGLLMKLGSAVILAATALALVRGGAPRVADDRPASSEPHSSGRTEFITYAVGYALALILTIAAFALVHWHWAEPSTALGIVFGLGLVQIVVHFRCFLHVSLREPARDDLQLILFSTVIVLLMVGGTLVVLFNLRTRMM